MLVGTPTSINRFQQLRNRQNDLYRKNTAAIFEEAKKPAPDKALLDRLSQERVELSENDKKIIEAELAFQRSQLQQSEAERRLVQQTQHANALVRGIKTLTDILNGAAQMAGILTRLIKLLK